MKICLSKMNIKNRKIEAFETDKVGYYNFVITYPSGKVKQLNNIPDKELFMKVRNLKSNVISNFHSVWDYLQDWM